jgi:uncharacterized protein YneF (UPF0154 family)
MIIIFFALASLTGYIIGYFTGRRCAQKDIQDMRLSMGLDIETGEDNNGEYQ